MRRAARVLVYLGIVLTVVGLSLVHARIIADPPYSYTGTFRFGWSLVYMALLMVTAYGFGLPDVPRSPRQALVTSVGAALTAALAISVVQLFVGDALLPRFVVFGAALVLVPWYLLCCALAGGSPGSVPRRERALVIGSSVDPTRLREEVARRPERPVLVVEVVPVSAVTSDGAGDEPLIALAEKDRITLLVLDQAAEHSPELIAQAAQLHMHGMRIRTVRGFYEEWLGMVPLDELEQASLLFDISELHRARYARIKRGFDLFLGALGAIVLLVVIPAVVVGDLIANRGSLFYSQERVGKGGGTFRIHKFRTMTADDGRRPNEWTSEDDPRITPFGRVLRRIHLDELPQVVDILRGNLAIVGPRPEQPHYVEELTAKLPFYAMRHLVRPGLTGWAQVKYGYAGDESDALEKLQYEFYYLRHQSLGLDLRIVGRTIRSVLGAKGR